MRKRCTHDPVRVVAAQPLFASLTPDECAALVRRSHCRDAAHGTVLFREGEACRGLYLVVEGAVRSYRASADGHEQVLGVFGPGASLGEVSLFDGGPCLSSARVIRAGRVLFLPLEEVQALYRTHPEVAHAVVRELGGRVRALAALVDQLALQDVPTRVAGAVLRYAERSGGPDFRLPRTQEELSAELGTTREGVARALRTLRTAGVLEQRGSAIRILDSARLQAMAAGGRPVTRPTGGGGACRP